MKIGAAVFTLLLSAGVLANTWAYGAESCSGPSSVSPVSFSFYSIDSTGDSGVPDFKITDETLLSLFSSSGILSQEKAGKVVYTDQNAMFETIGSEQKIATAITNARFNQFTDLLDKIQNQVGNAALNTFGPERASQLKSLISAANRAGYAEQYTIVPASSKTSTQVIFSFTVCNVDDGYAAVQPGSDDFHVSCDEKASASAYAVYELNFNAVAKKLSFVPLGSLLVTKDADGNSSVQCGIPALGSF